MHLIYDIFAKCRKIEQPQKTRKTETVFNSLKIPAVYDIATTEPSVVNDYDVIILGTPVHVLIPQKKLVFRRTPA